MNMVGHGGLGWRRDGEREREKEDSREDEEKQLCITTTTAGRWVCWVKKKEIVYLGLLSQTKISKDLFLRPKSPSLFHLSKALKL